MEDQVVVLFGKDLEPPPASEYKEKYRQLHFTALNTNRECLNYCLNNYPTHIFFQLRSSLEEPLKLKNKIFELNPYIIFIFVIGNKETRDVIRTLEEGGHEYIRGPLSSRKLMSKIFEEDIALEHFDTTNINQLQKKYEYFGIIGQSESIKNMISQIDSISKTDGTVLITGERGSGREIVAKAIHANSIRSKGSFIEASLSAIPENCIDKELYGHSSQSGPHDNNTSGGFFTKAKGGTIFLDEIDKISLEAQANMVHYLQSQLESNDGFSHPPFRIIASSIQPLEKLVNEGLFRYDLYYRINILNIRIPPLRERQGDIPVLINYFLAKYLPGKKIHISPTAMELLLNHNWPGNVRQLENIIERIVLTVSGNTVFDHHLPQEFRLQGNHFLDIGKDYCFEAAISEVEKSILIKALTLSKGNKKLAAKKLNLPYSTFRNKLLKLDIKVSDYAPNLSYMQ